MIWRLVILPESLDDERIRPLSQHWRRAGDILAGRLSSDQGVLSAFDVVPQFGRYLLVSPTDSPDDRLRLVAGFYDCVGSKFDRLAEEARNLENTDVILDILTDRIGPLDGRTIGDLGSGTGAGLRRIGSLGATAIGIDASP